MIKKIIKTSIYLLCTLVVFLAFFIIVTDAGQHTKSRSGAGDIWWMDVPEIEEIYLNGFTKTPPIGS